MNDQHPLIKYAKDTKTQFDVTKFRNQLVMAIAVSVSITALKMLWSKIIERNNE